jgi:hypothetical protein
VTKYISLLRGVNVGGENGLRKSYRNGLRTENRGLHHHCRPFNGSHQTHAWMVEQRRGFHAQRDIRDPAHDSGGNLFIRWRGETGI